MGIEEGSAHNWGSLGKRYWRRAVSFGGIVRERKGDSAPVRVGTKGRRGHVCMGMVVREGKSNKSLPLDCASFAWALEGFGERGRRGSGAACDSLSW